jgi:ribosomal protein S18 acetylase RimI-like enzyme
MKQYATIGGPSSLDNTPSVGSGMANSLDKTTVQRVIIERLEIGDMEQIFNLASGQFSERCDSLAELLSLWTNILYLFIPKLLWPEYMGHTVIGVKEIIEADNSMSSKFGLSKDRSRLIGFVDLSLQTNTGSLDALKNEPLYKRKLKHSKMIKEGWAREKSQLRPYVCNLLVHPQCRGRGYGRQLIQACETEAQKQGYQQVNLHVESTSLPALALYMGQDYEIEKTIIQGNVASNVVFMRKTLNKSPYLKSLPK